MMKQISREREKVGERGRETEAEKEEDIMI